MMQIRVPDLVHCGDGPHGGMVMLNVTTGKWHVLNTTAGDLWRSWQAGADFEAGVALVASRYPDVCRDQIRADAEQLLSQLVARDLLHVTPPDGAAAVTMTEAEPRSTAAGPTRQRLLFVAFFCLLLAVFCVRLPFRTTYRLVHASRKIWCRTPATWERASLLVATVHRVGHWYPGRAACLELSLAAVLLAALSGLRLDWCLGSAADPYRFHAWVEANGQPVPGPDEPTDHTQYLRVLSV